MLGYFAVLGVSNGDWLARIPAIKDGLGLSDGQLGIVLLAAPAGLVVAAALAGLVIDRVGSRLPTALSGLAVPLLPISFGLAPDPLVLVAAMFVAGVASGALDVAMNAQAVGVQREYGRPLMTSFHACYSFGALAGGLIAGGFAWASVGPVPNLAAVGALLAVLAIVAARWLLTDGAREAPEPEPAKPGSPARAGTPVRFTPLLLISLLALCSLLGEGAADGWSAVYLRDNLRTSAGLAAVGYAAFALTMAFGRLAGDGLAARLGSARLVAAGGLLAAVGMGIVILGSGFAGAAPTGAASAAAAITGFAVYGAGLSCTFPQLLSAAGGITPDRPASPIARVAGAGYVGLLCGPVVIGGLAGATGLAAALTVPGLLALFIAFGARASLRAGP